MAFLVRRTSRGSTYSDTLEAWRASADVVRDRWHQFRLSEQAARPFMYAAYTAALDHEEAAAAALAILTLDGAA